MQDPTGASDDARAAALVASAISLAHSLGLRIVAEGVENDIAYTELAAHGLRPGAGLLHIQARDHR